MLERRGFRGLVGILALLAAAPAWADDKTSYSLIDAGATRVDFADVHAHLEKGGFVSFAILTVPASGAIAYSVSRIAINCGASQITSLSNVAYGADGSALPTDPVDPAPQPIAPGTLGQALKLVICEGGDPYPRSKAVVGLTAALAKAHDLSTALQKAASK